MVSKKLACVPTVYNFDPKLFESDENVVANSKLTIEEVYNIWVATATLIKNDVLQYLNSYLNGDSQSKQKAIASINLKLNKYVQQLKCQYNNTDFRIIMRNADGTPRAGASTIADDKALTETQLRTPDIHAQVLSNGFVSTTKASSTTSKFETQFSKALDSFNPCSDTLASHTLSLYIS